MKLGTSKEILHNSPYVSISATISKDTPGTVEENGRKLLKAGSFVAGDGASIFDNREVKAIQSEINIDGITLSDVDVTDRDAAVAVVYSGTVWADKVNGGNVTDAHKEQLGLVKFVDGGRA